MGKIKSIAVGLGLILVGALANGIHKNEGSFDRLYSPSDQLTASASKEQMADCKKNAELIGTLVKRVNYELDFFGLKKDMWTTTYLKFSSGEEVSGIMLSTWDVDQYFGDVYVQRVEKCGVIRYEKK